MTELVSPASAVGMGMPRRRQRWTRGQSLILGGIASVLALVILFYPAWYTALACLVVTMIYASRTWPRAVQFVLFAMLPNTAIWGIFIALRGYGDSSPLRETTRLWARDIEIWLFGGELPSTMLQRRFFDPERIQLHDYLFLAVHASFFIVPSAVVLALWWADSARFRRTFAAVAITLLLGVITFALMPSNPPWMNPVNDTNPVPVERINYHIAEQMGLQSFDGDQALAAETNALAAMPSIHFGVTFLMMIALWRSRFVWRAFGVVNMILMGTALVYLGEHQVIDEVVGAIYAGIAWWYAPALCRLVQRNVERLPIPEQATRLKLLLNPR